MLVCTDAAARGLDIPAVSHIVQADFASTAIDFLHRVSARPQALNPKPYNLSRRGMCSGGVAHACGWWRPVVSAGSALRNNFPIEKEWHLIVCVWLSPVL